MNKHLVRVVDIDAGMTMVVTDLHGDWALYQRYRDVFLSLRAQGLADTLVLTGDFIHTGASTKTPDRSLDVVLDLLDLREALGQNLIVLLGNHEMPHLYHVTLAKGEHVYTPAFEFALGENRDAVLSFFASLPLYARTTAGVSLCHAGAFPEAMDLEAMRRLFTFSHQRVLQETVAKIPLESRPSLRSGLAKLAGTSYDTLVRERLAVLGPDDPRYDDYLIALMVDTHPDFQLLWSALFAKSEWQYGETAYGEYVDALLQSLSEGYARQSVLVAGHIGCRDGYKVIAEGRQLRLASGEHAHPYHSASYLLFDAGKPLINAWNLLPGIGSLFEG